MPKEKVLTWSNLGLALILMLFIFSFATVFTLNFRPLYYFDIGYLDIPVLSGLPEAEIRQNYDALIQYNSIFWRRSLEFPTLPMSTTGRIHFEEVKNIFDGVQLLMAVTLLVGTAGAMAKLRRKKIAFLKLSAILTLALPTLLGVLIAFSWQMFFVLFHSLFFNNDYWIFYPEADPVITILPDTYFLHCALLILAIVVLCSGLLYLAYRLLKKRKTASLRQETPT